MAWWRTLLLLWVLKSEIIRGALDILDQITFRSSSSGSLGCSGFGQITSNQENLWWKEDSKVVIDAVFGKCTVPQRIKFIVQDIKWLASSFELVEWNHFYKEANFTVDVITSPENNCTNLYIWDGCVPPQAKNKSSLVLFSRPWVSPKCLFNLIFFLSKKN